MRVVVGIDTHKDSHAMIVVDSVGAVVTHAVVPASPEGYARAIAAVAEFDDVIWGIEGAGSYGRGLVDALLRNGCIVYEVPGALTKRHRKHASSRGKSDLQDARAIAEVVLRERDRLPRCQQTDEQEAVRLLYDRRDRLVRARTEAINRLRGAALRLEVIAKYQNSSCEQLAAQKQHSPSGQQAAIKQKVIEQLQQNPQMREYFLNKVAGPIVNKLFVCGMIP
jgi:transposase